ncbi:hypothetical protein HYH03_016547 [Edaphochlamys debaryana]|uniref:Uncharacterized protein n=1 Tax=Edaphochlamys debaryana TaxID=47281 RepID=A0A835XLY3_9CHLO|nr:hypothetical protein HYH03_016547 [Edaphochlamys debaryana]|eukprot:KAG2484656.1 hypothetical protein HYH03_016547 [Edaphochlamys debaryana]
MESKSAARLRSTAGRRGGSWRGPVMAARLLSCRRLLVAEVTIAPIIGTAAAAITAVAAGVGAAPLSWWPGGDIGTRSGSVISTLGLWA